MGKAKDARRIAEAARLAEADRLALDDAKAEGRRDALRDMVTWLEERYMQDTVAIHSPEGKAIRELAGELTEHFAQQTIFKDLIDEEATTE